MYLGVREQSRVSTLPLGMQASYTSPFHLSLRPTMPHLSLKMRDTLDRAMDTAGRHLQYLPWWVIRASLVGWFRGIQLAYR
jgi:hypothetical protein